MDGHKRGCKALKTGRDKDCGCNWVEVRERQKKLLSRTLSAKEIDILYNDGKGIDFRCDESPTE